MILSMTGFSVAQRELPAGTLTVELRAVNHRFLDLTVRCPEEFRAFEGAMREKITGSVARGKVECRVGFNASAGAVGEFKLDQTLLLSLAAAADQAKSLLAINGGLSLGELMRWPGVLTQSAVKAEELGEACLALLAEVIKDFTASRGREGEKLKAHLLERVAGMEVIVAEVKPRVPQLVEDYENRLKGRFLEAMGTLDDDRVRQEIVMFAQKIDVDEELSRLTAHVEEVHRILDKGGAVGKRLDFLMQELNREANTLGSKSVSVETSRASMALKVLIEQMREQIQNLE